jgi:hypothetical protein
MLPRPGSCIRYQSEEDINRPALRAALGNYPFRCLWGCMAERIYRLWFLPLCCCLLTALGSGHYRADRWSAYRRRDRRGR